ncbi:MAG: bestrophin-like domain [Vulcanimicrobiaceae bacterium]
MPLHLWLAHVPAWVGLVLFSVLPALAAAGLHYGFRRVVPPNQLLPHHDVAGFLIAVVGVIYAVVLGFVVVNVWVAFDSAQRTADLEAGDVAELFNVARAFPKETRTPLQRSMADYAFEVRDREWPMLEYDRQDLRARRFVIDALQTIVGQPNKSPESTGAALSHFLLQQNALARLQDIGSHRRERLIDAGNHLEGALYLALFAGALIVLAFVFLFGITNQTLQLTMTALVAASIGLLFGVIVSLDRPYTGSIRVSPEAWTLIIENNHLANYRSHRQ